MIREGKGTGQRLVEVTVTRMDPALNDLSGVLGGLCDTFLVGVDEHVKGPARPHEFHVLKGDGLIMERLNGLDFEIGPETFFQTNTVQAEKMFAQVRECAAETRPNLALDLYSGVGSIALHLADVVGQVLGVESNEASVQAAERNIRRNGITNVEMRRAEVEKAPEGLLPNRADLVVVDPPRPGLHKKAIERIGAMAPTGFSILLQSGYLDPGLALFAVRGYRVDRIRLFDMFPHTFHIESVSLLKRV
jgi:tRNA/tmRNA/rRNA uracil-C5-methylase (TrmA/RlmC/RlmD family)